MTVLIHKSPMCTIFTAKIMSKEAAGAVPESLYLKIPKNTPVNSKYK